jgi:DNA-binding response OmpR family regulator
MSCLALRFRERKKSFMTKKKILVIDDGKDVCRAIKDGLEHLGEFKVISAYSGADGFRAAKKANPDLVLLDVDMPSMNGFEVLEQLKEDSKTYQIPVVMLTGQKDDVFKVTASRLYSEDYVTKPVSLLDLKGRIDAILARLGN